MLLSMIVDMFRVIAMKVVGVIVIIGNAVSLCLPNGCNLAATPLEC